MVHINLQLPMKNIIRKNNIGVVYIIEYVNYTIPGLSIIILMSFSDERRNFWNRRVGSGVKDLNFTDTEIPKPAGLMEDK